MVIPIAEFKKAPHFGESFLFSLFGLREDGLLLVGLPRSTLVVGLPRPTLAVGDKCLVVSELSICLW